MKIEENTYQAIYQNSVITLSGKLSLMVSEYEKLESFFAQILESKPTHLILDIRNLEFLNSSGIKTVCVSLILEASEIEGLHLKIICSDQYTWQKETIPNFQDLMDYMTIEFI